MSYCGTMMGEAIELSTREHETPEMNKLRQSLRRKKPTYVPEASRPHQWQADEEAVRKGKCNFPVRYLGLVEVEESRGMHVCEEAVKKLKVSGKKTVKAVLWVSADGLRVVDEKTKDLIVDQTIEKVSFCAPDRNYDKAFSYICRDGTTRRWICHCFMALKDSGERLSHAVGCAFAACLERKQRREKECGVTASFDASRTSFVREGSFRITASSGQQGGGSGSSGERDDIMKLQEKKKDPACAIIPALPPGTASPPEGAASPVERPEPGGPHAIPRRHAPIEQLVRQGSFRGFPALSGKNSPFKRQLSLRLNDLPSTLQRKTDYQGSSNPGVSEMDMGVPGCEADSSINALCSQINTSFTNPSDEFFSNPPSSANGAPACTVPPILPPPPPAPLQASWVQTEAVPLQSPPPVSAATHMQSGHKRTPSEAERWLEQVAMAVKAQQQTPPPAHHPTAIIPTIPGPPSIMSSQPILSSHQAPTVCTVAMSLASMSNPLSLASMSNPLLPSQPAMPLPPPMALSSVPLIPGPPMSGPPMSLPSMSIPTMSGPSMSGAPMLQPSIPAGASIMQPSIPAGAPIMQPSMPAGVPIMQPSMPGAPCSLPSSMQSSYPLVFDSTPGAPGGGGMFAGQPVQQPSFVPMQSYMPGIASSMTYPSAGVVPVVGITPSQMVANVFCTAAAGSSSSGAMGSAGAGAMKVGAALGGVVGQHHSFPGAAGHSSGGFHSPPFSSSSSTQPLSTAVNGLPPLANSLSSALSSAPATALQNGGGSSSSSSWPPEGCQRTAPVASESQEVDRFEAKWAALETKPASQQPAAAANPFSNDLQKTFEIEL